MIIVCRTSKLFLMINRLIKLFRKAFPVNDINSLKLDLYNTQVQQRQLLFFYQGIKNSGGKLPAFSDTGFRVFSQGDEDGKLLYIFSLIGFTNRVCVDMAYASPYGANTTNLICNWNFTGLLVEGKDLSATKYFFNKHKDTAVFPPVSVHAWITSENVNKLCEENGFIGEIDFFSLDMDGVDYWIWKELSAIQPRVVVVEYQDILGAERAITVPYKADFNRLDTHPDFFGASLPAFVKLGKQKGYRLVGTNHLQYNAFFVRNDIAPEILPEVPVESCFTHSKVLRGIKKRYSAVKDLPWVSV